MGKALGGEVLIRCDGGAPLGLGHVKRCLALAEKLVTRGLACRFAGRYDESARQAIQSAGFAMFSLDDVQDEARAVCALVRQHGARAVLFDVRTDLGPEALRAVGREGAKIVTLDDASARRLAADIAVLSPTAQALRLDWTGFTGEALIGWEWTVLAAAPPSSRTLCGAPPTLLVSMGGADPQGLTLRCARLLRPLAPKLVPFFVVGAAFPSADDVAAELARLWPGKDVFFRPPSLAPAIAKADFALVAYGVTAQELAAAGVPALYLALSGDHQQSAEALAGTGAGRALGVAGALSDAAIRDSVAALAVDGEARRRMSLAGRKALDGQGAERLARRIASLLV